MSATLPEKIARKVKTLSDSVLLAFPPNISCNLCGWQGRHFSGDSWHPQTICPRCGSQVRHRLLAATWQETGTLSAEKILRDKKVLHIAPEKVISQVIQQYTKNYVTADFLRPGVDMKLDITQMTEIADNTYDVFVACDVLEHVADDRQALQEIFRILTPQGMGIFTVPQADDRTETLEDPSVNTPEAREKIYGQSDHVRLYGSDIEQRIIDAGFQLTMIDETHFPAEQVQKQVLFPPVLSTDPLATNYRKLYFAQKP